MIPIRFGAANRQLFGLYQAPLPAASRGESILLCAPFGQEAIRSHRLFKVLADRLCRDGFHVLRFDYFGTGDSAGEGEEVSVESFIADVLTASDELVNRSGSTRCAWMGLRLGATIAAMASARVQLKPLRLILWEPVTDGTRYLAELADAQAAALVEAYGWRVSSDADLRDAIARECGGEALGFALTDEFRAALNAISVHSFATVQASVINIFEQPAGKSGGDTGSGAGASLAANLVARGLAAHVKHIADPIVWTADGMMNSAAVPGEVLQQIAACFATSPDSVNLNVVL